MPSEGGDEPNPNNPRQTETELVTGGEVAGIWSLRCPGRGVPRQGSGNLTREEGRLENREQVECSRQQDSSAHARGLGQEELNRVPTGLTLDFGGCTPESQQRSLIWESLGFFPLFPSFSSHNPTLNLPRLRLKFLHSPGTALPAPQHLIPTATGNEAQRLF